MSAGDWGIKVEEEGEDGGGEDDVLGRKVDLHFFRENISVF